MSVHAKSHCKSIDFIVFVSRTLTTRIVYHIDATCIFLAEPARRSRTLIRLYSPTWPSETRKFDRCCGYYTCMLPSEYHSCVWVWVLVCARRMYATHTNLLYAYLFFFLFCLFVVKMRLFRAQYGPKWISCALEFHFFFIVAPQSQCVNLYISVPRTISLFLHTPRLPSLSTVFLPTFSLALSFAIQPFIYTIIIHSTSRSSQLAHRRTTITTTHSRFCTINLHFQNTHTVLPLISNWNWKKLNNVELPELNGGNKWKFQKFVRKECGGWHLAQPTHTRSFSTSFFFFRSRYNWLSYCLGVTPSRLHNYTRFTISAGRRTFFFFNFNGITSLFRAVSQLDNIFSTRTNHRANANAICRSHALVLLFWLIFSRKFVSNLLLTNEQAYRLNQKRKTLLYICKNRMWPNSISTIDRRCVNGNRHILFLVTIYFDFASRFFFL